MLYTFSSSIILDQYQLRQLHEEGRLVTTRLSGSEKGKGKATPISAELYLGGQLDLEAPVSRVDPEQPAIAFLSIPVAGNDTQSVSSGSQVSAVDVMVELPLHLRYQEPVLSRWLSEDGRSGFGGAWRAKEPRLDVIDVEVTWPCVFWACAAESPETKQGDKLSSVSLEHVQLSRLDKSADFPYRLVDDSNSCLASLPSDIRLSTPISSPLHPSSTRPYHYLLPMNAISHQPESGHTETGKSYVSVPTGVMGDLAMVNIVNWSVTWIAVLVLLWQAWTSSRKWKADDIRRQVEAKAEEKKSD